MITANPFGVGASGESRSKRPGRCACCGLAYEYEWWPGAPAKPHCSPCLEHLPTPNDTDDSRTLARLSNHEPRVRAYADHAARAATKYEAQAKQALAEVGGRVAWALRQRDDYRRVLSEVYKLHDEVKGQCSACKSRYPCSTVKVLTGGPGKTSESIVRVASQRDFPPGLVDEW